MPVISDSLYQFRQGIALRAGKRLPTFQHCFQYGSERFVRLQLISRYCSAFACVFAFKLGLSCSSTVSRGPCLMAGLTWSFVNFAVSRCSNWPWTGHVTILSSLSVSLVYFHLTYSSVCPWSFHHPRLHSDAVLRHLDIKQRNNNRAISADLTEVCTPGPISTLTSTPKYVPSNLSLPLPWLKLWACQSGDIRRAKPVFGPVDIMCVQSTWRSLT